MNRTLIAWRRSWRRFARRLARAKDGASGALQVSASSVEKLAPRALISRLGIIVTCITVVVPPAIYAALSLQQLHRRAVEQASLGARHVEIQLPKQHAADWFNQVSITVLHATLGTETPVVATWLTDKNGATLMFQGKSATWPEFAVHVPIRSAGFDGYFHVAVSTREIFIGTMYAGIAFLLLGLAAYFCFCRLPLAALDEALRQLHAGQSRQMAQKAKLELQNLRFDAALNNMSQGLCMFDGEQRLVVCNSRYAQIYGLMPEQAVAGTTLREIIRHRIANGVYAGDVPEDYLRDLLEIVADNRPTTTIRELNDRRVIAIRHHPMPGGGWLSTHEDITEYRRIEARIAHMAHHDVLTELPNRVLLRERLEQALSGARKEKNLAVFCLDLDRFKDINDTLGHPIGDALLKAVGERLSGCVREGDTVARLGGDEFSIVQVSPDQPLAATALASRIIEAMARPFDLDGHQVTVGASIGIAVSPMDGTDPDQLMRNADLALYRAKGEGRGIHRFFEAHMDAHMQERCRLQLDLRKALASGEFELYYQPVVNLESNEISGLEALLRWHHPERGNVSPADFIPLAEETGLIVAIGEWVLRQACREAAAWPSHIKVAVNLSAVQFKNRHLVDTVFSALAASGLAPQRLELEITESVLLKHNDITLATLHQLRALGVRIALDDFGTGYSSLSYLRSFPFDKIKIDRCFVSDLTEVADDSLAILRAVAGLGSSLGIATTAEGVETKEQVQRVREEGCTEMQGYFFSPPRPIKDIARLFLGRDGKADIAAA
jgi:diguanylate cyclase (GGDEF)-like protein